MATKITSHRELEAYKQSFDAAMQIFVLSRQFPKKESFSLTDQIRRSSRSVCANIAEAWRKRRYEAAFIAKLNDAETEAAETQTWLEFAFRCGYISTEESKALYQAYNDILSLLVTMINHPETWLFPSASGATK